MKEKIRNISDLVLNLAIIATTAAAIGQYFVGGPDALGSSRTGCFRYFTTDSNVLAVLASLTMLPLCIRRIRHPEMEIPRWLLIFKYTATVSVTITLLTVVFFLAPTAAFRGGIASYFRFFEGNTFVLHFSTPVLAILAFCLLEKRRKMTFRESLWTLIPTVVYSLVYAAAVIFMKVWTDWYGFTFGGKLYMAPVSGIVMYLVTLGVAAVIGRTGPKRK